MVLRLLTADSVEKLFLQHPKQDFRGLQTINRTVFVDYRTFYEVSIFEIMIFELPKRVFQQNRQ